MLKEVIIINEPINNQNFNPNNISSSNPENVSAPIYSGPNPAYNPISKVQQPAAQNNLYSQPYPESPLLNDETKNINKLFTAWLVLFLAPFLLSIISSIIGISSGFWATISSSSTSSDLSSALSGFYGVIIMLTSGVGYASRFASYIISIIMKCKYPKNTKSNVAFWISMVCIALYILTFIVLIIVSATLCGACIDELDNCG